MAAAKAERLDAPATPWEALPAPTVVKQDRIQILQRLSNQELLQRQSIRTRNIAETKT